MYSNNKNAFTMVEILIFLLATTILLAASVPMITKKYKNVPKRLNHGRYVCYRDAENKLHEIKYNAKKEVFANHDASSCTFVQPQNTAMLKVQIIGSGAGGTQYFDVFEDIGQLHEGTFTPGAGDNSYDGDFHYKPSEEQLKAWYNQEIFTLTSSTSKAGNSGTIALNYASATDFDCGDLDNTVEYDGTMMTENQRYGLMRNELLSNCTERNDSGFIACYLNSIDSSYINSFCSKYKLGDGSVLRALRKGYTNTRYANDPAYLTVNYKLNLNNVNGGIETYLSGISLASGSYDNNLFSPNTSVNPGTKGENLEANGLPNGNEFGVDPKYSGSFPDAYAAVKFNNMITRTNNKPCPGQMQVISKTSTAIFEENTEYFVNKDNCKPDPKDLDIVTDGTTDSVVEIVDKSLVAPNSQGNNNRIKKINLYTQLNEKKHIVGSAGTAGESKTLYIPKIKGKCEITIPNGGMVWDKQGESQRPVIPPTTIKCVDDENNIQNIIEAKSGNYNEIKTQIYDMFAYKDKLNEFITTDAGDGGESPFKDDIFLKYNMPSGFTPGQGGHGSILTDKCMALWGQYSYVASDNYSLIPNSGDNTEEHILPKENATCIGNPAYWDTTNPTAGSAGAVIISW